MQITNSYNGKCLGALLVCVYFTLGLTLPGLSDDWAQKVVVDAADNVYVAGYSQNPANRDYVTIKYNASGAKLWERRYNGPADGEDWLNALVVDADGNVYVTGESDNGANADYVTIKYDTNGNWLWGRRFNGPANDWDEAFALAVDDAGNVIVTGYSSNGSNWDYVTIKYDTNGNWLWGRRYNGLANRGDSAYALAVDADGSVYVTGRSVGSLFTLLDYVTIKYDRDGNWLWGRRYNGPANNEDTVKALAVDDAGNVIVTGYSSNGSNWDYVTIKYDTNGNWLWGRRYNGPANRGDFAQALGADAGGNIYVTGDSDNGANLDYVTIKYSSTGVWLWGQRYNGPAHAVDIARALAVDTSGNVYVTGESSNGTNRDYVTIKYSPTGTWIWGQRYDGPD